MKTFSQLLKETVENGLDWQKGSIKLINGQRISSKDFSDGEFAVILTGLNTDMDPPNPWQYIAVAMPDGKWIVYVDSSKMNVFRPIFSKRNTGVPTLDSAKQAVEAYVKKDKTYLAAAKKATKDQR